VRAADAKRYAPARMEFKVSLANAFFDFLGDLISQLLISHFTSEKRGKTLEIPAPDICLVCAGRGNEKPGKRDWTFYRCSVCGNQWRVHRRKPTFRREKDKRAMMRFLRKRA